MNNIVILGAGLSGLISSFRLKQNVNFDSVNVYERNLKIIRHNSTAAFYCHKFLDEKITPNKKSFEVIWNVDSKRNCNEWENLYRNKVYGKGHKNIVSIKNARKNGWEINTAKLVNDSEIIYGATCTKINIDKKFVVFNDADKVYYDTLISTLPLPLLICLSGQLDFKDVKFRSNPIFIKTKDIAKIDKMIIEYFPDPEIKYYRKTFWKKKLTIESMESLSNGKIIRPGKIIPNDLAKEIEEFFNGKNIYLQGRYAKWSAKHLVSDTWNSIGKEFLGE